MAQTLGETQARRVLKLLVEGRDGEEENGLDSSIGCHEMVRSATYGSLQNEVYHRKQAFSNWESSPAMMATQQAISSKQTVERHLAAGDFTYVDSLRDGKPSSARRPLAMRKMSKKP